MELRPSAERLNLPLLERETLPLIKEQLHKFDWQSIKAKPVGPYNESLPENSRVMAIDIGGDSLGVGLFRVVGHELYIEPTDAALASTNLVKRKNGEGYLEALELASAYAAERHLPVGISF